MGILKKVISVMAAAAITVSMAADVNADANSSRSDEVGVSYEELQILFPYLNLDETWKARVNNVDDNKNASSHDIINTYQAEYDNGKCWVNIFGNGSYEVYGYEKNIDEIMPLDIGYNKNGTTYTSYYKSGISGFSYDYSVSNASSTSVLLLH